MSLFKNVSLAHVAQSNRETVRSEYDAMQQLTQRANMRTMQDDQPDMLDTIEFSFAIDYDYKG